MAKAEKSEHWTKLIRSMMQTPAWRALSPTAQALYPWLKLEWKGPRNNNNGSIKLSVRQAAEKMGVGRDTAARAFHDLQRKGFLVVTTPARLGLAGDAKANTYEITELAMPGGPNLAGRRLYLDWREGHDFASLKVSSNNPSGKNGRKKAYQENQDVNVIKLRSNG